MEKENCIALFNLVRKNVLGVDVDVIINEEVVELAKKHSLRQFTSEKEKAMQIRYSLKQNHLLERISDAFEKAGIDYMPLKGSVVKWLYPEIWMRSSGDIDILIHKEDMELVRELLEKDFSMKLVRDISYCLEYMYNDLKVEIHFRLINKVMLPKAAEVLGDGWTHAVLDEGHKYKLTPEAFYLYHLIHMAKHIQKGGCGIRFFVDLYLIVNKTRIDNGKLQKMLISCDMDHFEKCMREISLKWMNGEYGASEVEELLINGGTFGFGENGTAMLQAASGGKTKIIMRTIFLPIGEMRCRYPILNRCIVLLPGCYVMYWFGIIRGGKLKKGRKMIKNNISLDKEAYNRADRIMKAMGLK